jgi:dihydroxyacid dehydratase/phosphogluconate dehydratase
MGAQSMNLPAIFVPAGPMLRGNWRGETLGSGSDVVEVLGRAARRQHHRGDWEEIEDGIARSPGTLHDHGHRLDHDSVAEALGLTLPGASSIPAPIRATRAWRRERPAHRRDGVGGPEARDI